MKDKYTFPAVFEREENQYCVNFPDLGCATFGDNLDEAMYMAKDLLEGYLWGLEDEGEEIPVSTNPEDVKVTKGQFVVPITAHMVDIRNEMMNKSINKNVTLPRWLNKIAEENKINFSQVLQSAIKERLNIRN